MLVWADREEYIESQTMISSAVVQPMVDTAIQWLPSMCRICNDSDRCGSGS